MLGSTYRRMHKVLNRHFGISYNQCRSGYIVLLPEVDPELADKLLSINNDLPAFSKITKEKIGTIVGKHIVDYECMVRNADRNLEENAQLYSDLFDDVLNPLEKTVNSFDNVWGIFKTLYCVDKTIVPAKTYGLLAPRINRARLQLYNCKSLFEKCRDCDKSKLTEEQARYIDKIVFEGTLNGLNAPPDQRGIVDFLCEKLNINRTLFRVRVDAARAQFFLTIDDPLMIQEVPRYILKKMSHIGGDSVDGPWTVKLHYGVGEKYMEYCPDRDIRYMIWHAEDKAASIVEGNRQLANSVCLEEIRYWRQETAEALGYKNYFEANLGSKMAGSLENVMYTLQTWLEVAKVAQFHEIVKLQEFADYNHCMTPIQLWDISFWSRRQKKAEFNFDNELLRNYLPFDQVISGLFSLCFRLFGIRIEEFKNFDSWHPDVRFFYIYEPEYNKPVAGFYIDPYCRDNKIQATSEPVIMNVIRNVSRVPRPVMPLISFIMNFEPPTEKRPSLLSFSEALAFFEKFGHSLQYLLNKASYTDIAGASFVEFDSYDTCGKFLGNWIYDKKTFESISSHYLTGDKCPVIDLLGVKRHLAGFRLCKEMFKARMDIAMHTDVNIFWLDLAVDLWDDHFIFPLSKYFSDPCRYVDIFAENWGAAYYSHLWSEMLASDIFLAFEEEKDDTNVGVKFKDTFLTFGGSCHMDEVFRRFRGRDPNPQALLLNLGLIDKTKKIVVGSDPNEDPKLFVTC